MPQRPINRDRPPLYRQKPHMLLILPLRVQLSLILPTVQIRIKFRMTRRRNRQTTTPRHGHSRIKPLSGQPNEGDEHEPSNEDRAQYCDWRVCAGYDVVARIALHFTIPRLDADHEQTFGDEPVQRYRQEDKRDCVAVGDGEKVITSLRQLRIIRNADGFAPDGVTAPFDRDAH